jgi:hypothetical protein
VPTDAAEIRKSIGMGWWKYDVATAEKLLLPKGFKRVATRCGCCRMAAVEDRLMCEGNWRS